MSRSRLIALLLMVVTLAVYLPATRSAFVNYDDPDYVTENSAVQKGLTPATIQWSFATGHASNWHPLKMNGLEPLQQRLQLYQNHQTWHEFFQSNNALVKP